jgi:phosphonate transport system substrate-binding protein
MEGAYRDTANVAGRALGRDAELVRDAAFDELTDGAVDAAFLCGLPYVELRDETGGALEALAAPVAPGDRYGGEPVYFSDVVVRAGDPAQDLDGLRGRAWAYNEERSHSGHGVVLATLARRSAPAEFFASVVRTGSHERSLAAVRSGEADAAAIDSHLLDLLLEDDPGLGRAVRVIESLGPSPSQPLAAGPRLDAGERRAIREAMASLEGWAAVDDSHYEPIRAMRRDAAARSGGGAQPGRGPGAHRTSPV